MFQNTNSHGVVSLPFLGLLYHYFHDEKNLYLVKNATTELYKNLFYMTLSGGRQFNFEDVSSKVIFFNKILYKFKPKTGWNIKKRSC